MKKDFNTWLEWAMDIANKWKLQDDVRESYIVHINEGFSERASAEMALYDWDLF